MARVSKDKITRQRADQLVPFGASKFDESRCTRSMRHAWPRLLYESDRVGYRWVEFDYHQFGSQLTDCTPYVIIVTVNINREQVHIIWNGMAPQQSFQRILFCESDCSIYQNVFLHI